MNTFKEMFEQVKAGTITVEQFETWCDQLKTDAWNEGHDDGRYCSAMEFTE